jgi:DNA-binding transcriptional regulator YiaG
MMSLTAQMDAMQTHSMVQSRASATKTKLPAGRDTTPAEYKRDFLARIKASRKALGVSQTVMAERLGIPQDKYKQYEVRSMMPIYLLVEFCKITDQHPWFLLTGQSGSRSPGAFPTRPPTHLQTVPPVKPKNGSRK